MSDCGHHNHEPVLTMTGEHVATLCVDCGEQLPVTWDCPDCSGISWMKLGSAKRGRDIWTYCEKHRPTN